MQFNLPHFAVIYSLSPSVCLRNSRRRMLCVFVLFYSRRLAWPCWAPHCACLCMCVVRAFFHFTGDVSAQHHDDDDVIDKRRFGGGKQRVNAAQKTRSPFARTNERRSAKERQRERQRA